MDNNIYVTLSRQLALFKDMDVTANNIANSNTTGYDAGHILFTSYMTKDINRGEPNDMAFTASIGTWRNTDTGAMRSTGNALDMAIQGSGYFTIETPLGTRYTRAGNFQVASDGVLVTAEGYPVLDNSGQHITFPENTQSIELGSAGNIKVNGEEFALLGLAQFDNQQLMERLDNRLFKSDIAPQPADNATVLQGVLESSNVQPVLEMTHMLDVSRSVESTSKFIEIVYDLERKAANTWAQQS